VKDHVIEEVWQGPSQCRDCGIRDLVLFADLQLMDFRLIHQPITELDFPAGDKLYRSGEDGHHVFTIRAGLVKLVRYQPGGSQRILRLLRQGDVAGLEVLVGQPYQHDAVVLEPVSACRIPTDVVERLDRDTPRLHHQLLTRWHRALRDADTWLTSLSSGPAPARVARLLLHLAEPDQQCFLPVVTDIGAILGIAPETASRATAEIKRKGWMHELDARHVRIDPAALRTMAEPPG
jgi:CRP-like cAMP-binding protein